MGKTILNNNHGVYFGFTVIRPSPSFSKGPPMNTKTVARYKPTNRPDLVSQAVARLNHVLALMSQRLAGPHQCFPPRDHEPLRLERFPAEVGPGSAKKTRQSIDRERSSDSVRTDDALAPARLHVEAVSDSMASFYECPECGQHWQPALPGLLTGHI